jgi:hypothetical protein
LEKNDDMIGLLKRMNGFAFATDGVHYEFWTMKSVMKKLLETRQGAQESLGNFSKRFLAQLKVTEDVWGPLIPAKMKGKALDVQEKARNKYLACVFLAGVDKIRYEKAVNELNNDFLLGAVSYPDDIAGMMSLLSNRQDGDSKKKQGVHDDVTLVTNFLQESIVCYCCGKKGHSSFNCPMKKKLERDK